MRQRPNAHRIQEHKFYRENERRNERGFHSMSTSSEREGERDVSHQFHFKPSLDLINGLTHNMVSGIRGDEEYVDDDEDDQNKDRRVIGQWSQNFETRSNENID